MTKEPQIIGKTVVLSFPSAGIKGIPAKVDTGADGSSIWASNISEKDGRLTFYLLGPSAEQYNAQPIVTDDYGTIIVRNSFGATEVRYKVPLSVEIEGRKVKARFAIANRQLKSYPALVGRRLLNKRFLVDVSKAD